MIKKLIFPVIIGCFAWAAASTRAAEVDLGGYLWVGNNLYQSGETGNATTGMVSLSGPASPFPYQVKLGDGTDTRVLSGSAWLGIGLADDAVNNFADQNDLPSIGWIRIAQGIPGDCSEDCFEAKWTKKPGATDELEGYLSGWAKVELGGATDSYPETWIHFKAPPAGYVCSGEAAKRGPDYYVCTAKSGESGGQTTYQFHGYAWSSGKDAASLADNPGLGWIGLSSAFARAAITPPISPPQPPPPPLSNPGNYYIWNISDNNERVADNRVVCVDAESDKKTVKYQAHLEGFDDPSQWEYHWECDKGAGELPDTSKDAISCSYGTRDTAYRPSLRLKNKQTGAWFPTVEQNVSTLVTSVKKCSVKVRTWGSDESFLSAVSISGGDVEAKIVSQCLEEASVNWTVTGGGTISPLPPDNLKAKVTVGSTSQNRVHATMITPSTPVDCDEATVENKEKIRWGR